MADPKDNREEVKQNEEVASKKDELDDKDLDKAAGGVLYW